jgi:hypothetical protein
MKREPIYGIIAEFDSAQALVDAAKRTHRAGYSKIDAYSPSVFTTMKFLWSF